MFVSNYPIQINTVPIRILTIFDLPKHKLFNHVGIFISFLDVLNYTGHILVKLEVTKLPS